MTELRVAIIGTGSPAVHTMAPIYRKLGYSIETIASPRDAAAVRAAVAAPVDLVSIHSPPFLHAEHVNLALDHQRNVLCDKPFGGNVQEARQMLARAREVGKLHFINFEFRRHPLYAKLRELVQGGVIGKPLHLSWNAFSAGSRGLPHG